MGLPSLKKPTAPFCSTAGPKILSGGAAGLAPIAAAGPPSQPPSELSRTSTGEGGDARRRSVLLWHMADAEDPFLDCAAPPALAPSTRPAPTGSAPLPDPCLLHLALQLVGGGGRRHIQRWERRSLPRHQGCIPHAPPVVRAWAEAGTGCGARRQRGIGTPWRFCFCSGAAAAPAMACRYALGLRSRSASA